MFVQQAGLAQTALAGSGIPGVVLNWMVPNLWNCLNGMGQEQMSQGWSLTRYDTG